MAHESLVSLFRSSLVAIVSSGNYCLDNESFPLSLAQRQIIMCTYTVVCVCVCVRVPKFIYLFIHRNWTKKGGRNGEIEKAQRKGTWRKSNECSKANSNILTIWLLFNKIAPLTTAPFLPFSRFKARCQYTKALRRVWYVVFTKRPRLNNLVNKSWNIFNILALHFRSFISLCLHKSRVLWAHTKIPIDIGHCRLRTNYQKV